MLNFMQVNYILHGFCAPQNCPLSAVINQLQTAMGLEKSVTSIQEAINATGS